VTTSFGIDFGTSNCAVTAWSEGAARVLPLGGDRPAAWGFPHFDELVPSVFAQEDHRRLFGWAAKMSTSGNLQAVKRLLNGSEHMDLAGRTYSCRHVAALIFGHLRSAAAAQGNDLSSAVVTIPANSAGLARFRTREAARMAGIQVKALINEPTAAAMAYLAEFPDVERLFVYDWGGGTIDATLIEHKNGVYKELASRGISGLGGIEIDKRLRELIFTALPVAATYEASAESALGLELERTKIRLSDAESLDEEVPFATPDGRYEVGITRRDFEAAIGFLIEKTLAPVRQCLDDRGFEPLDVDAVLMVGGSSQIPRVRERLSELMCTSPVSAEVFEPMTAVSKGAAIAAAAMNGDIDTAFRVITGHALGTKTKVTGGTASFSELIRRGAALPSKFSKSYTPNADHEKRLSIEVWEGDPGLPFEDPENVLLTTLSLVIDPPRPRKDAEFLLEYRYDVDGILNITATDRQTGKVLLSGSDYIRELADPDPEIKDVEGTFSSSEPLAPAPRRSHTTTATPAELAVGRTVVVDGSNIACHHKNIKGGERPSYAQLHSALDSLVKAFPDDRIVVVVDANLRYKLDEIDRSALEKDLAAGAVLMPPAGLDGAGDALILAVAGQTQALVVSNDSFQEWQEQYPWIRQGRVLGATSVGADWFFLPRTPPQGKLSAPKPAVPAKSGPMLTPTVAVRKSLSLAIIPPFESLPVGWQQSHWWSGE
jgi:molecular chaperone DnaK (HSP70)